MESKGDPILDLQALCEQQPSSEDELKQGFQKLGWEVPFEDVFQMADGLYIAKGEDGLYHPRKGSIQEIIKKALQQK
jgi:hypothetical protein